MNKEMEKELQTFVDRVEKFIKGQRGKKAEILLIAKSNRGQLHGLVIKEDSSNLAPVIYLEEYFEKYQKEGFERTMEYMLELYESRRINESVDMDFFLDFEKVKENLRLHLIHYERNREFLEDVPYDRFLDLAIIPVLVLAKGGEEKAFITIRNLHLDIWKVSAEEVLRLARENQEKEKYLIEPDDFSEEEIRDSSMIIMSNETRSYGAIAMLNKRELKRISETVGRERLIILPYNIHEVLVLPDKGEDVEYWKENVKEANVCLISPEEVLSDSVYIYDRVKNEVEIC